MKMSLTRVLNEIKVLDSRIEKASHMPLVMLSVGGKPTTTYNSIKDMENEIKSNYDSVTDLIARRNKLKSLLVKANATTEVEIAGEKMTIAQAIDRKTSIKLEKSLLNQMITQFNNANQVIQRNNNLMQEKIDMMLQTAAGSGSKLTEEASKGISEPYKKNHETTLVDKINIRDKINTMEEKIERFESEVDFCLSEINAKTEIEVD